MIIHYTYNTVIYSKWLSICLSHLYRLFSHHGDLRCHQPELPVSIGQDNLPPFDTRTALEVIEEDLAAVKDWCFMGHGSESCPPKNTCFLVGKMMIEHAMFGSSQFSDNPNWWKFKFVNFLFSVTWLLLTIQVFFQAADSNGKWSQSFDIQHGGSWGTHHLFCDPAICKKVCNGIKCMHVHFSCIYHGSCVQGNKHTK